MSAKTYRNILEKFEPEALRLIGWGESTLHPMLVSFIDQADCLTHLNTNGSKLDDDMIMDLIDHGLDSIKFSFQGTDSETYAMMRGTDFFEGLLGRIARFKEIRGDRERPFISASTTTTDETPEQIEAFRNRIEPLVDEISIGKTIFEFIDFDKVPKRHRRRLEKARKNASFIKRHPRPCPEVFDKLTIHWDGAVRVCCNDYSGETNLGNVNSDSADEIWRHKTMEAWRKRLAKDNYNAPLCRGCFDYMELTDG